MARMPTPKMPKMEMPKAQKDALQPQRQPLTIAKPWDIINITTRMRETPVKQGRR